MERTVTDIRIDVSQIPDNVKRQLAASLLKAFREYAGRKEEEKKEKAPA